MARIALCLEYDGRAFEGWQTQTHGRTVQDTLQRALSKVAAEPVAVVCAGRTDTGVHAAVQVVHFDTELNRPITAWVRGVNAFLPESVAVCWAQQVDEDFHARFSAQARRYRYVLLNRPVRSALHHGRVGWFHKHLDEQAMQEAANVLLGEHDFSSFRGAQCQAHSPIRHLTEAKVTRHGPWVTFDFEANAFLHHMIRNMVGALVYVGKGAQSASWMEELLLMRDRRLAAPTFEAAGLYLCGVQYPDQWNLPNAGKILARVDELGL